MRAQSINPYIARLEAYYGPRYSAHTKRTTIGHATRFLAAVGTKREYSRQDMLTFVDGLVTAGYKEGTIQTIVMAVKAMFRVCELPWPLLAGDLHLGLPQEETVAPALSPHDVSALIRGVRTTPGLPRAVVALATIYGLRGDEIVRALATGCDGRELVIQTAKAGRKRRHVIPSPDLIPTFTFAPSKVSTSYLHALFDTLMTRHVRPPQPREGWHAVRRSVVTALFEAGISIELITIWMGWRTKEIAFTYLKPKPIDIDGKIYVAHPFLNVWLRG